MRERDDGRSDRTVDRRRLLAGTAAAATAGLAGCGGRTADGSVGVAGIEELEVSFAAGSLSLVGVDGIGDLFLQGVPIENGVWETVKALVDAVVDAILGNQDPEGVKATVDEGTLRLFTGPRFAEVDADIELRVPRSVAVTSVETGDGDVSLSGTRGDSRIRTKRGDVTARGVTGSPSAETGDGDVTVGNTDGIGDLTTADGSVTADVRGVAGDTVVRSDAGPVTVRVPPDLPVSLDARADDGSVSVTDGLLERRVTDAAAHVEGPVEPPADRLLRVASGDGPVEVTRL